MSERHSRQNRFSGGHPRHPSVRGGVQTVQPEQTISAGGCWCGLRYGHDWPGKEEGAPHPRGSVTEQEENMALATIDQTDMRRYPKDVRTLVMFLVNKAGVKYRQIDQQHMVLYPPDGVSRPFKIAGNRPGEEQVAIIEKQFMRKYGIPGEDGRVPYESEEEEQEVVTVTEQTLSTAPEGAREALRALAESLGVTIGGGVSEEDYLAVVAEKDGAESRAEMFEVENDNLAEQIEGLQAMVRSLTEQRDDLLAAVHAARDVLSVIP